MQTRMLLDRAPIATILRLRIVDQLGCRNLLALALGDHQQNIVGHVTANPQEKIQIEVGR